MSNDFISMFELLVNKLPKEIQPLVKQSRDGLLLASGYIDVVKFDKLLSKKYPEYNYEYSTYNGEPCSMVDFIVKKFGFSVLDDITQIFNRE